MFGVVVELVDVGQLSFDRGAKSSPVAKLVQVQQMLA